MKIRILSSGSDGYQSYAAGDICERDSEWARRMLINGHAEPLDEAAEEIAASEAQIERYSSKALRDSAPAASEN